MTDIIQFRLNDKSVRLEVDGERMLLWVLRTDLGLTGTKYGCGEGYCGSCTVLVNGEPTPSCGYPVKNVAGKSVVTIEGLAKDGRLHPVQDAFIKHEAMQCGFCTSGMIVEAVGFLQKNPRPSRADILKGMEDHLCRCGTHNRVVRAIEEAASGMKGAVPK
ncbi:MAG: (2Fe-2S)-binding protein [Candidatus Aminicenantes bacterium]|nr:(2Fe-2S)-binding protein [Candidatus Aminicenantes bacterium]